jgi:hypothetical protein
VKGLERMKEYRRDEKQEEEIRKAQTEGFGTKFDAGKERYDLMAPYPLNEIAKVYTYGTIKYDDNNWRKGMKWGKLFSAMMRHAWKWWRGERFDEESGLHHLAHAAWQCMALMEYEIYHPEHDDRMRLDLAPKKEPNEEKKRHVQVTLKRSDIEKIASMLDCDIDDDIIDVVIQYLKPRILSEMKQLDNK